MRLSFDHAFEIHMVMDPLFPESFESESVPFVDSVSYFTYVR